MKITLALFLILFKYLQLIDGGGELFLGDILDTDSKCVGGNCPALGARLNRRSSDYSDRGGPVNREIYRHLQKKQHSTTNVEQRIHNAANQKIINLLKAVKYFRNKLHVLATRSGNDISRFSKMDTEELNAIIADSKVAINKTLIALAGMRAYATSAEKTLRRSITQAGQSMRELAERYMKELTATGSDKLIEILNIRSKKEQNKKTKELEGLIDQMVQCSNRRLMDMYRNADSSITGLAVDIGSKIIELGKKNCDKLQALNPRHITLQKYVDFVCTRLSRSAQIISNKFYEVAKSCLKYLLSIANKSSQTLVQAAATLIIYVHAQIEHNRDLSQQCRNNLTQIETGMNHSNEYIYNTMMHTMATTISQVFDEFDRQSKAMKDCENLDC